MLDDFAGHGTALEVKENEMFVNSLAHYLIISFLIKQLVTIQEDRTWKNKKEDKNKEIHKWKMKPYITLLLLIAKFNETNWIW